MFIFKSVVKKVVACVGKGNDVKGVGAIVVHLKRASMLAVIVVGLASQRILATPISDQIDVLEEGVTDLSSATADASKDVTTLVDRYKLTNAGKCALLVAGTSSSNSTAIYFVPGPTPIAGLQADVTSSITITGLMTGPDADAAGKSVSSSPILGGRRLLLAGFNKSPIGQGNMAMVMLDTSQASQGNHMITLSNFSASGPDGNSVPLCATSGVITK